MGRIIGGLTGTKIDYPETAAEGIRIANSSTRELRLEVVLSLMKWSPLSIPNPVSFSHPSSVKLLVKISWFVSTAPMS